MEMSKATAPWNMFCEIYHGSSGHWDILRQRSVVGALLCYSWLWSNVDGRDRKQAGGSVVRLAADRGRTSTFHLTD